MVQGQDSAALCEGLVAFLYPWTEEGCVLQTGGTTQDGRVSEGSRSSLCVLGGDFPSYLRKCATVSDVPCAHSPVSFAGTLASDFLLIGPACGACSDLCHHPVGQSYTAMVSESQP